VWLYINRKYILEATDAFRELKPQKFRRTIIFAVNALSLVITVYM